MFIQVSLNVLDNVIESMHISMILSTNTRQIYMLCSATEIFLISVPALQYKLAGIIGGTFHIYDLGRLPKTINTRNLKVKEWVRFIIFLPRYMHNTNNLPGLGWNLPIYTKG